jgi:hypothetical protein
MVVGELDEERRARWIRSIAEGARQDVSSALGQMEGADDPKVKEAFEPLVKQMEAVHRALRDMT